MAFAICKKTLYLSIGRRAVNSNHALGAQHGNFVHAIAQLPEHFFGVLAQQGERVTSVGCRTS
jgi:hypothetical protein